MENGIFLRVEGFPAYWVSHLGEVYSTKTGRYLRGLMSRDGYPKVSLSREGKAVHKFVHRLVAEAHLDGEGDQVRHLDGDKTNNHVDNLAWGTCQENIMDKWAHGKMPHGEGHHANKIPEADIPAIRASKESNTALAAKYGVSRTAIYWIRKGKNYGWC